MSISFVGQAQSATTTLTVPAHNVGDDIYVFAYANVGTSPTLLAGYTSLANGTGGAQGWRLAHLIATTTSDGTGVWTNATVIQCIVLRGTNGPGAVEAASGAASTSVVTPSMVLNDTSGNSWVLSFGASKQSTSLGIISGLTQRGTTQTGTTASVTAADTNGGVSSFAGGTATAGTSAAYVYGAVEVLLRTLPPVTSGDFLAFM